MRLRIFGRHARHDFGDNRETVAELLARIDAMDVPPQPGVDEYPTATYSRFTLQQIEQRAELVETVVAGGAR